MKQYNTRYLIVIALLIVFTVAMQLIQNRTVAESAPVEILKIPMQIGEWIGEELAISDLTTDILETESVLMRAYSNPEGKEVVLAVVYYQNSRVALHLPESCYSGAGSFIVAREVEPMHIPDLEDFSANELTIKGNKGNQVALYYFETSDSKTHSYKDMRWQRMVNKFQSKSNNGALVRYSTVSTLSPEEDVELIKEFIQVMAPVLTEHLFNG